MNTKPTRLALLFALWCCASASCQIATAQSFVAQFDPSNGVVPSANNLLFLNSTDGTLNIPSNDPATAPLVEAINALDGFSTTAPQTTSFSAPIDPTTVVPGASVRVYEVGLVNPFLEPDSTQFVVTDVHTELSGGVDFTATVGADGSTLLIVPLRPLKPKTGYMVVLTDAIRSTSGQAPLPDLTYIFARYRLKPLVDGQGNSVFPRLENAQAQLLEQIRQVVTSQEDAAADAGLSRGSIVFSWTFMTQSINDVSAAANAQAVPRPLAAVATGAATSALVSGLPGLADIFAGTLQIPYYLDAPTAVPAVILSSHWRGANDTPLTRYNPTPIATQDLSIPVLVSVPNTLAKPATGWPVVIFQHGIMRNRADLVLVADALAAAGLVGIAIDLPLHGITDTASPLYRESQERTFNVDLINNDSGAPGADGAIDSSGTHFINLLSLLTGRDNLRQGAADLHQLLISLPGLDLDADGNSDLDINRIGFWGDSLGGIVGGVFVGLDQQMALNAAALTLTGGGVAQLLNGSETFGPVVRGSLAAAGIEPGSAAFEQFFVAAQHVIDSGDPINYALAAANSHPIYLLEVLGDQTVPNAVAGAPLSGSEPLARVMGLTPINASAQSDDGLRVLARFNEGSHGSALAPLDAPAAYLEIQAQTAAFLASEGSQLPVSNPALLAPAN